MTDRSPTPPGKNYRAQLAKVLLGESTVASIEENTPKKCMSVEDWLLRDHQRNALRYDVESIKRCVDRLYLGLCVAIGLLVSMFALLLLLLWLSR